MSHEVRLPNGKLLIFWFECQVCNKVSQTLDEFIDHKKCYHKLNEFRNITHFVLAEKPPLELESVNQFRVRAPAATSTTEFSPILKSTLNNNKSHANTAANGTGQGDGGIGIGLTKRLKPQPLLQKFLVQPSNTIASNSDADVVLPSKIQENGDQQEQLLLATTSQVRSPAELIANKKYTMRPQLATSNTRSRSFRKQLPYTIFKSADLNSKTIVKVPVKNECTAYSQGKQEPHLKSTLSVMMPTSSNASSISNNALKNPPIRTDTHNLRTCDSRGFTQVNEINLKLPSKILASASESSASDTDLDSQEIQEDSAAEPCATVLKRIQNYERQVRQINENNFSLKNWLLDEKSKMIVRSGIAGKNVILLEPDPIESEVGLITVKNSVKCKLCGLKLVSEEHLKYHVQYCWAENKADHIYCTICDISLHNTFDLRRHQYELHNKLTRSGRDYLLLTTGSRKEVNKNVASQAVGPGPKM